MKHSDLLARMSLEEKCALLAGQNTWESRGYPHHRLPSVWFSDGPSGLRKQLGSADHLGLHASEAATCFPAAAAIANSWDEALAAEVGRALGAEATAQGVHVLLGPGLNVKRDPLCGRNFEYFSEDPYLSGKMAAAYIRGIQQNGCAACPKHFAVNSQEERRMSSNSVLDERTLREIYLTGFEIAVKEGQPRCIMTSYNAVNDVYANENAHLLKELLREAWGFEGAVITDWGGDNDHVQGVKNGSSLQMPGPGLTAARELLKAVERGQLCEADIDARTDEVLELVLKSYENAVKANRLVDYDAHHALARRAASESIVLLKNEGDILPLKPDTKLAILGDFAWQPRYQGAGSSAVKPTHLEDGISALNAVFSSVVGRSRAYLRNGRADAALCSEAVELASRADVVLFYMGLSEIAESEGMDRRHMRLASNQLEVLAAVQEANPRVVVVLNAGSPIELPFVDTVPAIVHAYLGGQACASAVADVLCGRVNPSGKLAETLALRYDDVPTRGHYPETGWNVLYREGLYVGYRYFDTAAVPVRYPFGYGLSYTRFAYSELEVCETAVRFIVTNVGKMAGSEIAQLYVSKPDAKLFRAKKELKGFAKLALDVGESKQIEIPLDDKAFRYFNVKTGRWEIEGGSYTLMVGASSADIRLTDNIVLQGTDAPFPYESALPGYERGRICSVSDAEFARLLGRPIPQAPEGIHRNSAFRDMKRSRSIIGCAVYLILSSLEKASHRRGKSNLNVEFIYNLPLRALSKFAGGFVDNAVVDGLVMEMRGAWFVGILRSVGAIFGCMLGNARLARRLKKQAKEKR